MGTAAEDSYTQEDGRTTVTGPQLTGLQEEQPQGLLRKLTLDPPILGSFCQHGRVTKDISSKAEVDGLPSWYRLRSKKYGGLEA